MEFCPTTRGRLCSCSTQCIWVPTSAAETPRSVLQLCCLILPLSVSLSPFTAHRRLLHQGHSVPMGSVIGCIRNFKMNEEVLWDAESSYGTLPCFSRLTEKGTYFGGGYIFSGLSTLIHPDASSFLLSNPKSEKTNKQKNARWTPNANHVIIFFLDINFSTGSKFDLAFELRPHHLTGLLFIYRNDRMSIVVFMRETEVRLRTFSTERTAPDQAAANTLHYCSTRWLWKWTMEGAWPTSL